MLESYIGDIGKIKVSYTIANTIESKCLKTPLGTNEGRKYNSNAFKNRGNRTKRLALWNRSSSR